MKKKYTLEIIRLGLPSGITQAIFSMAMVIVQSLTNSFGEMVIAANVIIMRVDGFAMMPNFSFGTAMTTYNAYVKSPTAQVHHGFSAGSYRDLTRVAHLNPQMWSELMIDDADALAFEIDHLIESLGAYSRALKDRDQRYLENLLAEGDRIKRALDDEASH